MISTYAENLDLVLSEMGEMKETEEMREIEEMVEVEALEETKVTEGAEVAELCWEDNSTTCGDEPGEILAR